MEGYCFVDLEIRQRETRVISDRGVIFEVKRPVYKVPIVQNGTIPRDVARLRGALFPLFSTIGKSQVT